MDETRGADRFSPLRLLALAIADGGRLALLVGARWHTNASYTFVPLNLPGCVQEPGASPHTAADGLGRRSLGRAARLIASRQLYGPSEAHRIDRLPAALDVDDEPLPLLRLEREAPLHVAATPTLRRVVVTVYRARLAGPPALSAAGDQDDADEGAAGLLWLAPDTLRLAMRGMPFTELLAQPSVEWLPAPGRPASLPDDALVYVPADYGERHLLRLVAKYGPEALFQGNDVGWDDDDLRSAYFSPENP